MSVAMSISRELVRLSLVGEEPDPLTPLRLQKLLYYAQAWSLVIRDAQLFPEEIQAWQNGPVVADVHRAIRNTGASRDIVLISLPDAPDPDPDDAEFVLALWESYSGESATALVRSTHSEPPWIAAWGDRSETDSGCDPISVAELIDYFGGRELTGPLAAYKKKMEREEDAAQRKLEGMGSFGPDRSLAGGTWFSPGATERKGRVN